MTTATATTALQAPRITFTVEPESNELWVTFEGHHLDTSAIAPAVDTFRSVWANRADTFDYLIVTEASVKASVSCDADPLIDALIRSVDDDVDRVEVHGGNPALEASYNRVCAGLGYCFDLA